MIKFARFEWEEILRSILTCDRDPKTPSKSWLADRGLNAQYEIPPSLAFLSLTSIGTLLGKLRSCSNRPAYFAQNEGLASFWLRIDLNGAKSGPPVAVYPVG